MERTSKSLLAEVFPDLGKVAGEAARAVFGAVVRTGSALVGDISKEFGGAGMEGMEMGCDASRGVTAMGHSLLCAAVVLRQRARGACSRP